MAVLITGGLGVIGRRLAEHLREHGYDVKVTDVAIRSEPDYRRADVTRYEELTQVFRTWPIQHVFHLAGEAGRENGEQFPRRCVDINVSGTLNLVQLCQEYGRGCISPAPARSTAITGQTWSRRSWRPTRSLRRPTATAGRSSTRSTTSGISARARG